MKTSTEGIDLIKKHEGFRAKTYIDIAGYPTIGYGHKLGPYESFPNGITEARATELLRHDLLEAEAAVIVQVHVSLTQSQFDALVDFTYNLGAGNLASSTLLKRLNSGNYSAVPDELRKWIYASGKIAAGLVNRRADEIILWEQSPKAA